MTVNDWPDVEGGLRDWLRTNPGVAALVSTRVWFGIPDDPTFPLVTVARVGGGDDESEAEIDQALIQVDCWGRDRNKAEATSVALAVRKALHDIRGATTLKTGVVAYGAVVVDDRFLPDQQTSQPRYALTVAVTARAA